MATYAWKGVQDGKYAAGRIEGINRDEAAFKVKQTTESYYHISNKAIWR